MVELASPLPRGLEFPIILTPCAAEVDSESDRLRRANQVPSTMSSRRRNPRVQHSNVCDRQMLSMPSLRTNRSLLEGFRAGSAKALETVYWEYVRKVERLLSGGFEISGQGTRVGGACHQADERADLVQEVFARAFSEKARRAYDGLRDYGPYLYAIARNVLVDWARARGREIPASWMALEAAIEVTPRQTDLEPWAAPAIMKVVEEYLAALPQELRDLHRLRYEEGLSQAQAAERLGVGRQTVRTLERRLREGLATALEVDHDVLFSPTQEHRTSKWKRVTGPS